MLTAAAAAAAAAERVVDRGDARVARAVPELDALVARGGRELLHVGADEALEDVALVDVVFCLLVSVCCVFVI